MASVRACNDTCGCTVPCPGGNACRCQTAEGGEMGVRHSVCTCGEHCSCNPCTCGMSTVGSAVRTGRGACTCGTSCDCSACGKAA